MDTCLLKVNGVPIPRIDLRPRRDHSFELIVSDSRFGEFPLAPTCLIEFLEVQDDAPRDASGALVWKRLTYDELVMVIAQVRGISVT